jgi:hypothetical protein
VTRKAQARDFDGTQHGNIGAESVRMSRQGETGQSRRPLWPGDGQQAPTDWLSLSRDWPTLSVSSLRQGKARAKRKTSNNDAGRIERRYNADEGQRG